MDIYQIIITYNKAWTKEETVCFGIILIFLSGILAISVYKHKILKQQAVAILLLVSYQNRCKTLLDGGRRRVKKFMEFF